VASEQVDEQLIRYVHKFGGQPSAGALFLQRLDLRDLWRKMASSPGKILAIMVPTYYIGTYSGTFPSNSIMVSFSFLGWGCNQCCGFMTFWGGSGSGFADPCL
jgi:hypothetical protein